MKSDISRNGRHLKYGRTDGRIPQEPVKQAAGRPTRRFRGKGLKYYLRLTWRNRCY